MQKERSHNDHALLKSEIRLVVAEHTQRGQQPPSVTFFETHFISENMFTGIEMERMRCKHNREMTVNVFGLQVFLNF